MRIKHPYGFRLRRRLAPSGPSLNFSSQKIVGTKTVSNRFVQIYGFRQQTGGPALEWLTAWAHRQIQLCITDVCSGWSSCQSRRMVVGQPIISFTAPATSLGTIDPSPMVTRRGINIHSCYILLICAFLVDKALRFFKRNLIATRTNLCRCV
jgi:hypothetical protein